MKEYAGRNTLLKAFQLIRQALKNAAPSAGDGVEITQTETGPEIGLTTPVQGVVTQAEFDTLPEAEQNKGLYVISDGGGGSGGGGNPIGTIISFMGLTAPEGYLVCDGTTYNIIKYPALAAFFEAQFGAKNHFGGDGTTTFAVPDMRNLFLRGYHGEAEQQLSDEVGKRQEGTISPNIMTSGTDKTIGFYGSELANTTRLFDSIVRVSNKVRFASASGDVDHIDMPISTTSRPVNMAVLYCIKAVEISGSSGGGSSGGGSSGEVYSTEETRIGTWIDGKPLYRKTFEVEPVYSGTTNITLDDNEFSIEKVVNVCGFLRSTSGTFYPVGYYTGDSDFVSVFTAKNYIAIRTGSSSTLNNAHMSISIEYTKTTDEGVTA